MVYLKPVKRKLLVKLLGIVESLFICVKWHNVTTVIFTVNFRVTEGAVMCPFLFAICLVTFV